MGATLVETLNHCVVHLKLMSHRVQPIHQLKKKDDGGSICDETLLFRDLRNKAKGPIRPGLVLNLRYRESQ